MWVNIMIVAFICLYAGYVIVMKIKDIKKGKCCSCSCETCISGTCNGSKYSKPEADKQS